MPYKGVEKAREASRIGAAKYLAGNKDAVNARKRAAYSADLEVNRAKSREHVKRLYHVSPERREKAKQSSRKAHLWTCFRLTPEEYETILAYQRGVCASCGKPPERVRLAVDHQHSSGRVRGLLCWICNRALGDIHDRQDVAYGLARYLESPPAPVALGKETYGLIGQAKASKKVKVYGPPVPPNSAPVGKGLTVTVPRTAKRKKS